jgi:hypothetical protein
MIASQKFTLETKLRNHYVVHILPSRNNVFLYLDSGEFMYYDMSDSRLLGSGMMEKDILKMFMHEVHLLNIFQHFVLYFSKNGLRMFDLKEGTMTIEFKHPSVPKTLKYSESLLGILLYFHT